MYDRPARCLIPGEPEAGKPAAVSGRHHWQPWGDSQEFPVIVQSFQLLDKAQRSQAHMPQSSHLAICTPGLQGRSLAQTAARTLLQSATDDSRSLQVHSTSAHSSARPLLQISGPVLHPAVNFMLP